MNKKSILVCFLIAILAIVSVVPAFAAKPKSKGNANSPQVKLNIALKEIKAIDSKLNTYKKKEIKLPKVNENSEQQTATLWVNKDKNVKLVVTQLDDVGQIGGEFTYYFKNGKLIFQKTGFANHLYENGKMLLWLDNNMKVLKEIPQKDMIDAQNGTIKYVSEILKKFK